MSKLIKALETAMFIPTIQAFTVPCLNYVLLAAFMTVSSSNLAKFSQNYTAKAIRPQVKPA